MIKLALPKGRLLTPTSSWLKERHRGLEGYHEGSRSYRLHSRRFPQLRANVFQERDIPIQVSVGNYDLGICGQHWVEELLAKYPASPLLKLQGLGYGEGHLYLASSRHSPFSSLEDLRDNHHPLRLASEYPNLMESLALRLRLRSFKLFPLWGAAENYPPEDADLVLLAQPSPPQLIQGGLQSLARLLSTTAVLIANRESWQKKDMGWLLSSLGLPEMESKTSTPPEEEPPSPLPPPPSQGGLRLALPDGHQQPPTVEFLRRAGLQVEGYAGGERRPDLGWEGVGAKVIRPQDMPQQVACGHFHLAITGQDWLQDHLNRFPSSPVVEVMGLGFGRVRVVAVVSRDSPWKSARQLGEGLRAGSLPYLRVVSEYTNIADKYAQDNHLSPYKLIPTWGASEAFLPEDADLLIENTQTGQTLARHNLQAIDVLFESSACLIASRSALEQGGEKLESFIRTLRQGLD